ncbi:hypothetical protein PGUG_03653 [Meyerozyma guilliermondii ATCC 6260]|uniref:Manganese resistance protein MNR2 n=1 Tax=Meyerozyma guilliermondii (strain ATCC 6260 / CBS 566 / DSM 6381 / JCM 1539 / NBRC 10279 / NRRL Y-324) TaxID=294746 RepID=A5DK52_PICGU|nr:uncharacterized protein PGUG_03653 [Meyerozyma guilliermondii ATCC 6260]EDK39555.2 hypothetical protein PGUG_03653 [Meyerozyma guilliermondii ATCC 6260]
MSSPRSESEPNPVFIDHRNHDDLAHLQASPARARRRSSHKNEARNRHFSRSHSGAGSSHHASLPLTNRNLQQLLASTPEEPENGARSGGETGAVSLDMDQYQRQQADWAIESGWNDPFGDNRSINSLEFGASNPSSDHSSDSTSLDDVCFPDYYDQDDGKSTKQAWPDLDVLEEFVEQEVASLAADHDTEPQNVNFRSPVARRVDKSQLSPRNDSNFSRNDNASPRNGAISPGTVSPGVTSPGDENTPLLATHVNEIESLESLNDSFRVRPTPIQPWEKSKEKIPTIWNPADHGPKNRRDKLCRFTYFREDLDSTIHSPTLSGLVGANSRPSQKASKLTKKWRSVDEDAAPMKESSLTIQDLFAPFRAERTSAAPSIAGGSSQQGTHPPSVSGENLMANQVRMTPSTQKLSAQPSILDNDVTPYWLDVLDPTEEEMKVLSKTFGIHPLTTEDIFLGEAREKVELFKQYYFVCFTSFDIVYERRQQRKKEQEKKLNKLQELESENQDGLWKRMRRFFRSQDRRYSHAHPTTQTTSHRSKSKRIREGELQPLNMYMIVFREAVITFHFSPTPHPINVRRRARLLRDFLTVSSDWICYALIDDITDSFAPMIESIETEVNSIEDAILKMHSGDTDTDDSDSDDDDEENRHFQEQPQRQHHKDNNIFYRRTRSKSVVEAQGNVGMFNKGRAPQSGSSSRSKSSSSSSKSTASKIIGWKRKGDMLRRIGECRKRVMSVLRLLGSKADVIKGFNKRLNDQSETSLAGRSELSLYLGDISDHIVTMVQSLNHYEKLLARFHSNYLAQINIDMTKVNNDTNDVLGKITILGTIVLPINVVTGLWGMNCLVPGQDYDGLLWFWSIIGGMVIFSLCAYQYAKRVTGL